MADCDTVPVTLASLESPERLIQSPWQEHAPFAFWLIEQLLPRLVVELGVYAGYSYCALCQAVSKYVPGAKAVGIDTWLGDEHSGFFGEAILADLAAYHDRRYAGFSALLRSDFDEAVDTFTDGSIDLLHIDGRHFYDDVRRDFAT